MTKEELEQKVGELLSLLEAQCELLTTTEEAFGAIAEILKGERKQARLLEARVAKLEALAKRKHGEILCPDDFISVLTDKRET